MSFLSSSYCCGSCPALAQENATNRQQTTNSIFCCATLPVCAGGAGCPSPLTCDHHIRVHLVGPGPKQGPKVEKDLVDLGKVPPLGRLVRVRHGPVDGKRNPRAVK